MKKVQKTDKKKPKKHKFNPVITRIKLQPEQASLSCCYPAAPSTRN